MKAALFIVAAAALWLPTASGGSIVTTVTSDELVCGRGTKPIHVEATYHVRPVSVQVSGSIVGPCVVNVTLAPGSVRRQPARPPQLLLVKIEQLRLGLSPADAVFYVAMSHPTRRTNDYCSATHCSLTYLWATESVELYLYILKPKVAQYSYEASIVVAEATNVCALTTRTRELLVENREYAFAPDARHMQLPPNNINCAQEFEYSLTVRSSVASVPLNVTVLACPSDASCATLLLNERSCSDGDRTILELPGSNITLRYWRRRGCHDETKFAGFIVIAQVGAFAGPSAFIALTASVTTLAAASLAIGVAAALLCYRHRRRRLLSQKPPSNAVDHARSTASAGYEAIAMTQNDLYSEPLCSRKTADP